MLNRSLENASVFATPPVFMGLWGCFMIFFELDVLLLLLLSSFTYVVKMSSQLSLLYPYNHKVSQGISLFYPSELHFSATIKKSSKN